MTDLMFKAQKYMNRKDALTANGIDGKQKMEEFNELQHKKKEKKDHSPSQKNDNKYTGSYKIVKYSRNGTCYLESLNGKQLPRLWNVEHFKRYYRYLDDVFNFLSLNCFLSRNE